MNISHVFVNLVKSNGVTNWGEPVLHVANDKLEISDLKRLAKGAFTISTW
jgi:hypothetical protein